MMFEPLKFDCISLTWECSFWNVNCISEMYTKRKLKSVWVKKVPFEMRAKRGITSAWRLNAPSEKCTKRRPTSFWCENVPSEMRTKRRLTLAWRENVTSQMRAKRRLESAITPRKSLWCFATNGASCNIFEQTTSCKGRSECWQRICGFYK